MKNADAKELLPKLVKELMDDQQRIKKMQKAALKMARQNAANQIAQEILEQIEN